MLIRPRRAKAYTESGAVGRAAGRAHASVVACRERGTIHRGNVLDGVVATVLNPGQAFAALNNALCTVGAAGHVGGQSTGLIRVHRACRLLGRRHGDVVLKS